MNTNSELTLGSLFSGSGGFELAGVLSGVKPVWLSEVEPFAGRITEKRFQEVKQYGDVKSLSGADLPPVDIITFGSPCQDMSVAGRREGLDGSRSGLFYEAIRIITEMREATDVFRREGWCRCFLVLAGLRSCRMMYRIWHLGAKSRHRIDMLP